MKSLIVLFLAYTSLVTGNPSGRISGGVAVDITTHPYATSLLSTVGEQFTQVCGGTVISSTAVLSAASCFVSGDELDPIESWRARVGSTSSDSRGIVHVLRRITPHPNFVAATLTNDIAVLRTTFPFTYDINVQPAYLAGGAYNLTENDLVRGIGWGALSNGITESQNLREVQMRVISQQTCAERYNQIGFTVQDTMLCAGWLDVSNLGQCSGDTGGPLLHNDVVVGVYSWTEGCGSNHYPNINTRLSSYTRWVESTAVAL